MYFILAILMLVLSVLVAWYGKDSVFGFWGNLFLSVIITPIVSFLIILLIEGICAQRELRKLKKQVGTKGS